MRRRRVKEANEPGQAQGAALVSALYGEFNFGGRLPLTYPKDVGQTPFFYNHKGSAWANGYSDLSPNVPVFPFGFGLSYSSFTYSNLTISPSLNVATTSIVRVSFTLHNSSPIPGTETPQLYLTDRVSTTTTPEKALRGFVRVHVAANESVEVVLQLNVSEHCSLVDLDLNWTVEPGVFDVVIASDSSDAGVKLRGNFTVVEQRDGREVNGGGRVEDEEMRRRRVKEANELEERARLERLTARQSKASQSSVE